MRYTPYFLSTDVYFCETYGRFVFLDLRSDKYLCLDRENSETLSLLLRNNPALEADHETENLDALDEMQSIITAMTDRGIITRDFDGGKNLVATRRNTPQASLISDLQRAPPRINASTVSRFFLSASLAAWRLRKWPLVDTVQSIQAKKEVHGLTDHTEVMINARELASTFETLRPLYPRDYLCLFDSLALLYFLNSYGVFPTWVFGVKTDPFEAHCWIEKGGLVFNDTPEFIRDFVPIMSV